jgi:hypothetical protein
MIKESDWKLLRKLKPVALDRLCKRILDEGGRVIATREKSAHERYLELFKLLERRNHDIESCFDDQRRSNAVIKLAAIYSRGLLNPEEFSRFSDETQAQVAHLRGGPD